MDVAATFSTGAELFAGLITISGIAYNALALLGARAFVRDTRTARKAAPFLPSVSILKPVKGIDPRMYAGFVSHCQQQYGGEFEIVFGVSSLDDPAVAEIVRLREEFPNVAIQLIECAQRMGTSGKVSNLIQMLPAAQFEHIVVNDGDILVGPQYLTEIMRPFADAKVGLVTAPYIGLSTRTTWSKLEALGISTDFMPGVLTARKLEGSIRFGLGSTLATTKTALATIGGFESLVDQLADDYELGARLAAQGYRVELAPEVVETDVPAYTLRGYLDHQLRWARSTRDSRRAGYIGLGITYVLPWAVLAVVASGAALWSIALLSFALFVRVTVALTIGVGLLKDVQVIRDLWLLPLRDFSGLFIWGWSYSSDVIVWRGEKFRLHQGKLERVAEEAK
ncbi:bacteriohopanetetrol glucosamine biosynthesis glycosyltransferase HpnI [Granulicella cerasi]|uniref:Bacteriohopanetetrol glucosamine biosynthesis glycosyltransferase HpnI n=1 Tax=Granulicella cerasi TaxID=741063 RepID=A0ABW1ZB29_9BACT|nr:bacteriohopanetetrol glucosamine biosynthesis glycosyltransferase HpnI [Granulicella cerasi]